MSKYTQTISSILRENARAGEDVNDLHDICDIAKRCLFDGYGIQSLPNDYRDRFITGFSLHFFNDEIGMETLPLFKMGLSDKLYNNGEYIGQIYSTLDTQLFSDYKTRATTGHNTSVINMSEGVDKAGSITNAKSGSDSTRHTGTASDTKTGTDTTENTGTSANVKSGNDTVKNTGSTANQHTGQNRTDITGTDVLIKSGTETTTGTSTGSTSKTGSDTSTGNSSNTKTGSESKAISGTDTIDKTGSDSLTKEGTETEKMTGGHSTTRTGSEGVTYGKKTTTKGGEKGYETNSSNGSTDTNAASYNLDTPMDNLELLRVAEDRDTNPPTYVPYASRGKGISASYAQDANGNYPKMRYMTNAGLTDSSAVTAGQGRVDRNFSDSKTEATDSGTDTTNYNNVKDEFKYGATGEKKERSYDDYSETTTHNTTETDTKDLNETTTHNVTDTGITTETTTHNTLDSSSSSEQSQLSYDNRTDSEATTEANIAQFNESNTRTDNLQSKTEYASSQTRTDNLTQQTEYDTTSTHSQNLQDTVQYGSTNTQVINTNDSKVGNTSKNDTLAGDEVSTALNLEMIYRSMPLLNKVWEIFDELFMSIY